MNKGVARLTVLQRQLAESNIGLARRIAWKYFGTCKHIGMDWDDVFSIACMGLMRAARTFDPEKSRVATYLTYGCEHEVLMELRKQSAKSRSIFSTVHLQDVCGRDRQGNELRIEDVLLSDIPSPEDAVMDACTETQIRLTIQNGLNVQQKRVLNMHMNGFSQKEIARVLDCSQSHVSRTLTRIRNLVMEELAS